MPIDQQQAQAYLNGLIQQFDKDKATLTETERRAIFKHKEAAAQAANAAKEAEQLHNQITQAQARLRSLELQMADFNGKSNAHLEFLISLKFEDEAEMKKTPKVTLPEAVAPTRKHGKEATKKSDVRQAA
jgi:hypothetical protein